MTFFKKNSKTSNNYKQLIAFTLAEVLITLSVIGIVADMTIPTLVKDVKAIEYKISYKKAYSELYQTLNLANSDNVLESASGAYDEAHLKNFKTLMTYLKIQKECYGGDSTGCWFRPGETFNSSANTVGYPAVGDWAVIDIAGRSWATYGGGFNMAIMVDTNGFKKPNQFGKDRFYFNGFAQTGSAQVGFPVKIQPVEDNDYYACHFNKCETKQDYFGTSWLYN